MTPKTQQPLHPYSVKIETPTGKSAALPVTLLTPKQAEEVQVEFKRMAHESMCNESLPMTTRRSSARRRHACGLPWQRRHDRASLHKQGTGTAPSIIGAVFG